MTEVLEGTALPSVEQLLAEGHTMKDLPVGTVMGDAVYIGDLKDGSDAWHAQRATGIGGSDIASVCGVSGAFKSRYILWLEKAGYKEPEAPDEDMEELFEVGHLAEPLVVEMFERRMPGVKVALTGSWVSSTLSWHTLNVDGVLMAPTGEPYGLLECKYSTRGSGWENDLCPPKYVAQLRYYLKGFGFTGGYLACLCMGKLLYFWVPIDATEPVINMRTGGREWYGLSVEQMLSDGYEFMLSLPNVNNPQGTPPPLDGGKGTAEWLTNRNPEIDGKDVVIPHELAIEWAEARDARKAAEERESKVKAQMAVAMGTAKAAKAGYGEGKKKAPTVALRKSGKGGSVILMGQGATRYPEEYELKLEDQEAYDARLLAAADLAAENEAEAAAEATEEPTSQEVEASNTPVAS